MKAGGRVLWPGDLQIHGLATEAALARARTLGITRAPTVAVDGRVAVCCAQSPVDDVMLRGLGVGARG